MAFDRTKLALKDSANNTTIPRSFSYTTTDTDTVVSTEGYFNSAADILAVGDVVYVNADTDGSPVYGRMRVLSNSAGVVDVADIEAWATTDTE
jgi:hypothetical protein